MQQFESVKRGFDPIEDPSGDQEHFIHFPLADLKDDPENSIQADTYTLTQ
jgi:hypothetical protein